MFLEGEDVRTIRVITRSAQAEDPEVDDEDLEFLFKLPTAAKSGGNINAWSRCQRPESTNSTKEALAKSAAYSPATTQIAHRRAWLLQIE